MSTPTLKDVSAAIADPIARLGLVRDAAGTHGVYGRVLVGRQERKLSSLAEHERLAVAIMRAREARASIDTLERMLVSRRERALQRDASSRAA